MKKQYNGLDLLKFAMALAVIMIHVKPNQHSNLLNTLFDPILSIAVPVFFVISSMLIFSKLKEGGYSDLWKYCKRLGLLYFSWLIIDGWFIWANKPYLHENLFDAIIDFAKDILFATTYPGSWYLSASVVGVVLVYVLSRYIHPVATFLLSFVIAYYISHHADFSFAVQRPYEWYATHLREDVHLSFPAQMVWISVGQLLSICKTKIEKNGKWLLPVSVVLFLGGYVVSCLSHSYLCIMVVSIFIACFLINLSDNPIYKRIRNYSILMFFFHFSIAGKMNRFCAIVGDNLLTNYIYYFMVVALSILFAEIVMRLEKTKHLGFMKYLH